MTQMLQARSSGDVNQYCSSEIWTDSSFYTSYSFSVLLQYVNNLRMLIFFFFLCFMQCCLCLLLASNCFGFVLFVVVVIAPCLLSKSVVCYFKNEIKLVFIVTVNNTTAL